MMRLAKPHLDIGLFVSDVEAEAGFWATRVGLGPAQRLPFAPGWVQHRFDAHGSVIKVNHLTTPLPARPPSGYTRLSIAAPTHPGESRPAAVARSWSGTSPGGVEAALVAPGEVTGIGVTVSSSRPAELVAFYRDALGFEPAGPDVLRCGDTLLTVVPGPEQPGGGPPPDDDFGDLIGPGYRYLTVQVFDADAELAGIVDRGGRIVRAAVNYAGVARFGFVADPDGNWIEISARTSLTGIDVPG